MDYYQLENNRADLLALLEDRRRVLQDLLRKLEANTTPHPGGMVKAHRHFDGFQYYRKEKSEEDWTYIPKEQRGIAETIINCEYRATMIKQVRAELEAINRMLAVDPPKSIEEPFRRLSAGRQALIHRFLLTDEEAKQAFLNESYKTLEAFEENKQYETQNGELVRSKSELIIADALLKAGVPYQYEYPIHLKKHGTVYADFRCLNVRRRKKIVWEHLGKMGDEEYATAALQKVRAYEENGYVLGDTFIITAESARCPLTTSTINRWIKRLLL